MAAEGGQPAPKSEAPAEKKEQAAQGDQKKGSKDQSKAPAAAAEAAGEKKLSNAELKKKAKEEKAARRAATKVSLPQPPASAPGQTDGAKGKPKPKQDGPHAGNQHGKAPAPRSAAPMPAPKEAKPSVPECFSHLAMAKGVNLTHADKDVHPAVLLLGQQMSTMAISDSTTRLEATLLAFKKVKTPSTGSFRWSLESNKTTNN